MAHIKIHEVRKNINAFPADSGFWTKFKANGSEDMRANGEADPVIFTLEDLPDIDYFLLNRVSFLIGLDANPVDLNNFGEIPGLTNGIRFIANQDTQSESAEAIIKTNGDVFLISSAVQIDSIRISGSTQVSQLHGTWDFTDTFNDHSALIRGKDLKIIIRDDLTGLSYFKVSCHGVTVDRNRE